MHKLFLLLEKFNQFIHLSLVVCIFGTIFKKFCLIQVMEICTYVSSQSFRILDLIFKYVINFELTLYTVQDSGSKFIFSI